MTSEHLKTAAPTNTHKYMAINLQHVIIIQGSDWIMTYGRFLAATSGLVSRYTENGTYLRDRVIIPVTAWIHTNKNW